MAQVELTQSQVKELGALDQAIQELQMLLVRAQRAGLPVDELQRRLSDANSKRVGLLREFTPGIQRRP